MLQQSLGTGNDGRIGEPQLLGGLYEADAAFAQLNEHLLEVDGLAGPFVGDLSGT